MKKAPEAFRTISEVADLLDTPAHVLRFWESKFYQIRPVKRAGGRRYYRPDDVALINGIKALLQDRGMTIRGAQRILQEQGAKAVVQLGLPLPDDGALLSQVASQDDDSFVEPANDTDLSFYDDLPSLPDRQPDAQPVMNPVTAEMTAPGPEMMPGPQVQPEDQQAMESRPAPGYAELEGEPEGGVASPNGRNGTAEGAAQANRAHAAPHEPEAEDVAMSSDDLLSPPAASFPETLSPPHLPDAPAAAPRPRLAPQPEGHSEKAGLPVVEAPERMRIARALRAMPRHAPGVQRDRLAILARRVDALLDRMSEASGAGRW